MSDVNAIDAEESSPLVLARLAKAMEGMPAALNALTRQIEEMAALQRVGMLGPERIFDFLYEDRRVRLHLP